MSQIKLVHNARRFGGNHSSSSSIDSIMYKQDRPSLKGKNKLFYLNQQHPLVQKINAINLRKTMIGIIGLTFILGQQYILEKIIPPIRVVAKEEKTFL